MNILVFSYFLWGTTIWILAYLGELGAFQNLGHVSIPLQLITLLLPGSQVTANEAEACLVQGHAYRYTSLHIYIHPYIYIYIYVYTQNKLIRIKDIDNNFITIKLYIPEPLIFHT